MRYGTVRSISTTALAGLCAAGAASSVTSLMAGGCPCEAARQHAHVSMEPPLQAAMPAFGGAYAGAFSGGMQTLPVRPIPPPPGTLTTTYLRPSRPVPDEKHPRLGMLEVCAPPEAALTVRGMKGYFGDDNLWHFESKEPLVPGVPHIYNVVATRPGDGSADLRVVRLIPGRIVTLEF